MSVSHCLHHALKIVKTPRNTWRAQLDALPTQCPHVDCGVPRNCHARNEAFLTMTCYRQDDSNAAKLAARAAENA